MKTKMRFFYILTLLVFLFTGCKPKTPDVSSGLKTINEKSAELTAQGAVLEIGGAQFNLAANNLSAPAAVGMREIANPYPVDDLVMARSNIFLIDNLPWDFAGEITVTLDIPKSILKSVDKNDAESAEKISLIMWVTSYSQTSGGYTFSSRPVDARVDLENATISTDIDLESITAVQSSPKLALKRQANDLTGDLKPSIGYSIEVASETKSKNEYESENFKVFVNANVAATSVQSLLTELEAAKKKIENLGFSFGPFNSQVKFPVYVKDCDRYSGTIPLTGELINRDGVFTFTWYKTTLEGGSYMDIHPRVVSGDTQTLQAVVGHELMHYAQLVTYFPRSTSVWNNFALLDEAVAVWFESRATNNEGWQPVVAIDDSTEFIKTPWYYQQTPLEAAGSGYGASWFIHYLVDKFGTAFIQTAYSSGFESAAQALKYGLGNTYSGVNLREEFLKFLPEYLFNPGSIHAGLADSGPLGSMLTPNISLAADPSSEILLDFKPKNITSHMNLLSQIQGNWMPDNTMSPAASITLSKNLSGLNGFLFSVIAEPVNQDLCPSGVLNITYDNPIEGTGLLVYSLSTRMDFVNATALADPETPLTGNGPLTISVPGFGDPSCGGAVPQVAILLYNINDSDASNISHSPSITLEYNLMPGEVQARFNEGVNELIPAESPLLCAAPQEYCNPVYNPCPESSSSGHCDDGLCGQGGGDGDLYPDCDPKPDYCYFCNPDYCAAMFNADNYSNDYLRYNSDFKFTLDPNRQVTSMEMLGFSGSLPTLVELTSSQGTFISKWSIVWPNCQDKSPGYLIIEGTDVGEWNGKWEIGHPAIGPTLSGTWSEYQNGG